MNLKRNDLARSSAKPEAISSSAMPTLPLSGTSQGTQPELASTLLREVAVKLGEDPVPLGPVCQNVWGRSWVFGPYPNLGVIEVALPHAASFRYDFLARVDALRDSWERGDRNRFNKTISWFDANGWFVLPLKPKPGMWGGA